MRKRKLVFMVSTFKLNRLNENEDSRQLQPYIGQCSFLLTGIFCDTVCKVLTHQLRSSLSQIDIATYMSKH